MHATQFAASLALPLSVRHCQRIQQTTEFLPCDVSCNFGLSCVLVLYRQHVRPCNNRAKHRRVCRTPKDLDALGKYVVLVWDYITVFNCLCIRIATRSSRGVRWTANAVTEIFTEDWKWRGSAKTLAATRLDINDAHSRCIDGIDVTATCWALHKRHLTAAADGATVAAIQTLQSL